MTQASTTSMQAERAAHTPGPWTVGTMVNGNWIEARGPGGIRSIARTFYDDVGAATEDANARLIAAAPDLLEVLLLLDRHGHTEAVWQQARAAIAKARGEA